MDILASVIKAGFRLQGRKRPQTDPALRREDQGCLPLNRGPLERRAARRSQGLKQQIADYIAADEARIVELKARLELPETSLEEKEKISKEIDETTKRIDEQVEDKLDEILPEAFAIMKDTARRFAQNDTIAVTANDFDRELAATKDFVTIEGDKAVYANHWMAGGNDMKWDMIHYDCQLLRRRGADAQQEEPRQEARRTRTRRQHRRNGDGRGQDARGDAPRIPQCAGRERACTWSR